MYRRALHRRLASVPADDVLVVDKELISLPPSRIARKFVISFAMVSPAKSIVVTTLLASASMEMLLGRSFISRKSAKSPVSANRSRLQRWTRPKSSTHRFLSRTLAGQPTVPPRSETAIRCAPIRPAISSSYTMVSSPTAMPSASFSRTVAINLRAKPTLRPLPFLPNTSTIPNQTSASLSLNSSRPFSRSSRVHLPLSSSRSITPTKPSPPVVVRLS